MSAYAVVLFMHSALRWALLIAVVVVLVRSLAGWRAARPWTRPDDVAGAITVGLLDVQLLLGLLLYAFLSPATQAFLADPRTAMANPGLRFFGMEHAFAMVIALVVGHLGRVLSRRVTAPERRQRNAFVWALVLLVVLLIGIPWPFLAYGRPLSRGL